MKILRTILILIVIISYSEIVNACECAQQSIKECFDKSDVVFKGEIVSVKEYLDTNKVYHNTAKILVLSKWKGELTDTVYYDMPGSNCDIYFQLGKKYIVFGLIKDNVLKTSICTNTKLLSEARKEIETVDKLISKSNK